MKSIKKWGTSVLLLSSGVLLAGCSIALPQLTQEADQPKLTVTKEEQEKYFNFMGDTTGQILTLTASFLTIASDFLQNPKNIQAFSDSVSKTMTTFHQSVLDAMEKHKKLNVPAELQSVHKELSQNLNQYDKGISDVNEGVNSGDVLQVTNGIIQIQQAQQDMEELQNQYVK